jgi:CrcB protein
MGMKLYLSIAVLGLVGIFLRFGIDKGIGSLTPNASFPWGIWVVNILGCFLATLISYRSSFPIEIKMGLLVGFCGGFTTFSTYSLQSVSLWEEGKTAISLAYALSSPVIGILVSYVTLFFCKKI